MLLFSSEDVKDIVRAADANELADIVTEIFVKETLEVLSERSEVLQNPEFSDFLGEGEGVVLCGGCVLKKAFGEQHRRLEVAYEVAEDENDSYRLNLDYI